MIFPSGVIHWCDSVTKTFSLDRSGFIGPEDQQKIPESFLAHAIGLLRTVVSENEQLRKVLACEAGQDGPEGWAFNNQGEWKNGELTVYKLKTGLWCRSTGKMVGLGEYECSIHNNALEAMLGETL